MLPGSRLKRVFPHRVTSWVCRPLLALLFLAACAGCASLKQWAYEGFGRNGWQHPEQVIRALNLQPGDQVADLGAGSGYFALRLAQAVGPRGKVYAVDIDPEMTDFLARRAREAGQGNIEVILAKPDDPLLPESGMDLIFTCNTYHHLEDRSAYFAKLDRYLRRGGRIAIIDFNGVGWFQKLAGHWTGSKEIQQEMQQAGYRLDREFDFLPKQVFLLFSKASS